MPPVDVPLTSAPGPRVDNMRGIALMALGMFLFAMVDAGAKFLTDTLHPFQIVWTRQLGLLFGVFVLLGLYGRQILETKRPKLQLLRGAIAGGSATFFIIGVSYVPLADAVAVTFVAPFMVTIMGALILREKVGIRRWMAVLLGFVGTLVVIRPGTGIMHPAVVLLILAAALFAGRQIISRALSATDRTVTTIAYTALTSSALLTIPLPFVWVWPTDPTIIAICVAIAFIAAAAEICVIKALEIALSVVVAPVQYSMLIWGTFYGFVIFGQLPDGWTLVGALILMATGLYTLNRERIAAQRQKAHG